MQQHQLVYPIAFAATLAGFTLPAGAEEGAAASKGDCVFVPPGREASVPVADGETKTYRSVHLDNSHGGPNAPPPTFVLSCKNGQLTADRQ